MKKLTDNPVITFFIITIISIYLIYTLTNKDSTKGKTIKKLLEYLNIEPESVLAFGDNYNDISMFEVVDGVAVENAQDSVKQLAKYTTKSNEEDGVSYFIKMYL